MVVRQWAADPPPRANARDDSSPHGRVGRAFQRPQAARLHLRRLDDRLRLHAERRHGRRSPAGVLQVPEMKIRYDPEVDALSIVFRDTTVSTKDLAKGLAAEYDADGQLVGLELLDAAKRFGDPSVLQQIILEGLGPAFPRTPTTAPTT